MSSIRYAVLLLLAATVPAGAENIRVATWNIENFHEHFLGHRLTTRPVMENPPPEIAALIENERRQNNEDNWEVAQVILDEAFRPDVLVVQESCRQSDLEFFNRRWLNGYFETVVVFPSNTEREQHLSILLRPGFKIVDRKDQYHLEPDTVPNAYGDKLFARGPAFVLVESPGGYRFWVGTNHMKSKRDNTVENTAWRNREAKRTHEIIRELQQAGPDDVVFLGDMNDEPGLQQFEQEGGGDTIANLLGDPARGFILVTKPLVDAGKISFGGYWQEDYRSFIDHIIATPSVKDQVVDVKVIDSPLAKVASDHYPVMMVFKSDAPANGAK
jgi:endonuclease/exonuclease/phosphatase family metal-dependent hydrolase